MSDLSDNDAAESVKIIGADTSGVESTPVQSTTTGALYSNLRNNAGTEIATSAAPLRVDPTGTTIQPISGTITANQGGTWNSRTQDGSGNNITSANSGSNRGLDISLVGASDGTRIGNSGDSLKVTSTGVQDYVNQSKMFSASFDITAASAGSNNPLLLFRNPSGSGKVVYIYSIQAGCAVANVSFKFRLFANPTVTSNGTARTPRQRNIGSATVASSLINTLPTVSSSGNELSALVNGQNTNSVVFAEGFSIEVQPNNAFLITGDPLSNNRAAVITITWVEL